MPTVNCKSDDLWWAYIHKQKWSGSVKLEPQINQALICCNGEMIIKQLAWLIAAATV